MNIVFVYRKKIQGRYSLENVFNFLIPYLKKKHNIRIYYTRGHKFLFEDIFHLRSLKADIYHIAGDINYFSIFLPKKKTILTIPDVGHYIYGLKNIKKFLYKWLWIKLPFYCAQHIVTISNFSKSKILNIINKNNCKIDVIPCCYREDLKFFKKKFEKSNIRILFVGTGSNKNLTSLIKATKFTNWKITIIGKISISDKILLDKYKINYKNLINVNFKKIIKAYKTNDILCFLSLHEGFGLPVIEANVSGVPVIASNIEPIKTVAGKAAYLVSPRNIKNIKKSILKIINNEKLRNKLVLNGLENIKKYHPSLIAKRYCQLYNFFYNYDQ